MEELRTALSGVAQLLSEGLLSAEEAAALKAQVTCAPAPPRVPTAYV